ncbi:hypothetical protein Glove_395g26 [Diversispora epigaea]|uniref:Uncharacterized protein n=1 Tax=Diversispora epigaea TaxID=1348612 RepID=A0A397H1W9_9GLOM|nr:hypothetical protein Glove_395g26 [Diversispora epigaea]
MYTLLMAFSLPEPGKSKLLISKSTTKSQNSRHEKIILEHPFNHQMELLFPTVLSSQQIMDQFSKDPFFFYKANIPLSYFIDRTFINTYVKGGCVRALSLSEGIDISNVISLDESGTLILNLTKDTYEQLGLTGKPSKYGTSRQRFVVQINLLEKSMIPGKKGYERVKWCFENSLTESFPFLISFIDIISHESKEMKFPSTFNAKKLNVEQNSFLLNDILIPEISEMIKMNNNNNNNDNKKEENKWKSDAIEIYDWLGLVSLKSQRLLAYDQIDPYISLYSPPEPYKMGDGTLLRWTGFIPSAIILSIFKSVLEQIEKNNLNVPWIVINIWGFKDSPISWNKQEHNHFMSGENNYSFLIWPDGSYTLYQALGEYDNYSI